MNRIKRLYRVLLAAVWLLAVGQSVFDAESPAHDGRQASLLAGHDEKVAPVQCTCFLEHAGRSHLRRCWSHSASAEFSPLAHLSAQLAALPDQVCLPVEVSDASIGLANSWQFRWRTALPPRAPSLTA